MVDGRPAVKGSLVPAVVGVAVAGLTFMNAAVAQVSCREWNTGVFFETATPADVSRCLETGANLEARTELGWTPLHGATVFSDSPAVVRALLSAGANLEARDEDGWTPLHLAAGSNESPAMVKALLSAGANVEARTDEDGVTPLHLAAARNQSPTVVKALLDAGANPKVKTSTSKGLTPWDFIQDNDALKGTDVYWLLQQAQYE